MRIIRGKYGRRRFDVPQNITARPTTDFARENIFNVLDNIVDFEGCTALDLFAGTGAISFEFLSRGCAKVTCVEKSSTQFNFIRRVRDMLNEQQNLTMVKGDVFRFVEQTTQKFDIIFADPLYALDGLQNIPDKVLERGLLHPDRYFILEHGDEHSFSDHPAFVKEKVYGRVHFSFFTSEKA